MNLYKRDNKSNKLTMPLNGLTSNFARFQGLGDKFPSSSLKTENCVFCRCWTQPPLQPLPPSRRAAAVRRAVASAARRAAASAGRRCLLLFLFFLSLSDSVSLSLSLFSSVSRQNGEGL